MKGVELHSLYKCKIIVFHSVEHHIEPSGMFIAQPFFTVPQIYSNESIDIQRMKDVYEKNAQGLIDSAKEVFREEGIEIEGHLIYDQGPLSYIQKMVKKEQVDLVIIGRKGTHSRLEEILTGSIAGKLLTHVSCDVLVVGGK
jgi:nucleotide-binding universal stress UspA family protein